MLKFFSSFTFLYAIVIATLLIYGFLYYRSFNRSGYQPRRFPWIFLIIGAACFSFLYLNFHAPLRFKAFSNLDHHFIRHEGFSVAGGIELGRTDTVHYPGSAYNKFMLKRSGQQLEIRSTYAEEPFYTSAGKNFKLLSPHFQAANKAISFRTDSMLSVLSLTGDTSFTLKVNGDEFRTARQIRKGLSAWEIFKDEINFINSPVYTNEKLVNSLKSINLLRNDISSDSFGELNFFISGRLYRYANTIRYGDTELQEQTIQFNAALQDQSTIAWGMGFLDNNRNQFRVQFNGTDSFSLLNKYPVSYPMAEERKDDWTKHEVNKFIVSDTRHLVAMPAVFTEGFLFAAFNGDSSVDFNPVLLSYKKGSANDALQLKARSLSATQFTIKPVNNKFILPARSSQFGWIFTIQDSFNWRLGGITLKASTWQWLIFGTLGFFFLLVFCSSLVRPTDKLSWIWQLLSCVTLVLLTTRFFLYWRYKSFPPYEGLDLPSMQQLNTPWNFGIIIITGIVLALVFGWSILKKGYGITRRKIAMLFNKTYRKDIRKKRLFPEKKW